MSPLAYEQAMYQLSLKSGILEKISETSRKIYKNFQDCQVLRISSFTTPRESSFVIL